MSSQLCANPNRFPNRIDEIEDDSVLPGRPINSANYYFVALNKLVQSFPSDKVQHMVKIYSEQMMRLHEGQGMDIYWRDARLCPSIGQYMKMINLKTTSLFYFSLEMLRVFSDEKMELTNLCTLLGDYFQIRDDYANLKLAEVSWAFVSDWRSVCDRLGFDCNGLFANSRFGCN